MSLRVSIIIPCFNAQAFVPVALRSLQAQAMSDWEAIVIDDGSTDGSLAVVRSFAQRDPRVRVVEGRRGGVAAARNAGLERARGALVGFLDADDWLLPGALGLLADAAERSPGGGAYGGSLWFDEGASSLDFVTPPTAEVVGLDELLSYNRFSVHAQLVRRECVAGARFDASLQASEDWAFWLALAASGVCWHAVHVESALDGCAAYRSVMGSRSKNFRGVAASYQQIVSSSFAAARRDPELANEFDLGVLRERRVLLQHMLEAASAAALTDPSPRHDMAAAILAPIASPGCVQASSAASAAYWGMPRAVGEAPSSWSASPRSFCPAAARWWRRLEAQGWAPRGFTVAARASLISMLVEPRRIAELLASELDPTRPCVVLGYGQNGRQLAYELAARKIHFSVRDRSIGAGTALVTMGGVRVEMLPESFDLHDRAQYIATPSDDRTMIEALPVCLDVRRWNDARRSLEIESAARILSAWPSERTLGAMEAAA